MGRKQLAAIPAIERATHVIGVFLGGRPDLNVSQAEAHVLAYLHGRKEARINDIHEAFGHRRSTLTSVLDRLEVRKLLKRAIDPADRRSIVVTLTRAGVLLAAKVFEALRDYEEHALRAFSPEDVETFKRVLASFSEPSAL
jgi:DNA-binding MarR family transcriptional regulator